MSYLRAFGAFWWNFIVGDDWRLAVGVALALGLTWVLAHEGADVWWLLPVGVALALAASLWRETRRRTPRRSPSGGSAATLHGPSAS